jgi:hypothetical protein
MYLVLSPSTRIRHQSLMMATQGHAVLAASQPEELLLVFSSQGGTLLGSVNLGSALMKLRSITGTRLPTMMATPLILPLPLLLIERINSLFIFNFYFSYFYFPFVSFMFSSIARHSHSLRKRLPFLFSWMVYRTINVSKNADNDNLCILSSFCLYIR